jgi:hypothetical protein
MRCVSCLELQQGEKTMSPTARESAGSAGATAPTPEAEERIPMMQQLLDNPFALLFLGVTVPTVFYILWGVMEILSVPLSPLAR